ncbi:hypothetical protein CKO38_17510 [Rhodospirillum rubrum]|uniref:hypothetical protein n=1 Tax=Rhodospirillum rubrum TaxID=1085 RepID=UPI0019053198|nr:hypothetical protein [Rhodospirillum rubrum]MBK1666170.1 hypothetical protein [Rhodospirillum rubrum]MBK1678430.1 hypothetical protein [Rhodospirillum rubrum]
MRRIAPVLASLLALTLAIPPVQAAEGAAPTEGGRKDKIAKRARNDAALTGGEIIELETLWIPTAGSRQPRRYIGITVRLVANTARLEEACYTAPWVNEALIIYFNDHPLAGTEGALAVPALTKALKTLADQVAGKDVFKVVKMIDGPGDKLAPADAELTLSCG